MNYSRGFLVVGVFYILLGMLLGMYMGGSGNHTMAPLHAHINLLGFVLPAVFALVYRQYPAMREGLLPKLHFWLHQLGTAILLIMLFLLFSGRIAETSMAPISPIAELAVVIATAAFAWNVFKNVK